MQGRGNNVIHCRKDGTWSGSFHVCQEMQGECSAPDQLNSNLKLQCPEGYAIGTMGVGGELCMGVGGRGVAHPPQNLELVSFWDNGLLSQREALGK